VANTSAYRSTDAGKTFTAWKGAPGGDDYHTFWINPDKTDTILLAGDQRLAALLAEPDWLPIASRIRSRLGLEALPPKALQECLNHLLKAAGNPLLLSPGLAQTLCEHAAGNLRLLMNMANELLAAACQQERERLDEKLYFEVFALDPKPAKKT